MPEIDHEVKISATPEQVFAALSTREGVASWQTPHTEGNGEVGSQWRFIFTGRAEFDWEVVESETPSRVVWLCTKGPGDSVGTTATFLISTSDDRTLLELKHSGWPGTHGNFRKCNTIWAVLLHHIQQYVQTGTPATAFD
jgi:uncharacterized protein YndB with AHSA1/START domain